MTAKGKTRTSAAVDQVGGRKAGTSHPQLEAAIRRLKKIVEANNSNPFFSSSWRRFRATLLGKQECRCKLCSGLIDPDLDSYRTRYDSVAAMAAGWRDPEPKIPIYYSVICSRCYAEKPVNHQNP